MQPGASQLFDPKSILDVLMRGGAQSPTRGELGDLLRQGSPSGQSPQPTERAIPQDRAGAESASRQQSAGDLDEMLRNVLGGQAGSLSDVLAKLQQQGGTVAQVLGQALGQATSGVRDGANRID